MGLWHYALVYARCWLGCYRVTLLFSEAARSSGALGHLPLLLLGICHISRLKSLNGRDAALSATPQAVSAGDCAPGLALLAPTPAPF
jgi:hypothetical protein